MTISCEVLILGAGAAGCASAVTCMRGGANVVIAASQSRQPIIGECLSPKGRRLLGEVFPMVDQDSHAPYLGTQSRWANSSLEENSFLFGPDGNGLRLDRVTFDKDIEHCVSELGASRLGLTRLGDVTRNRGKWELRVKDGELEQQVTAEFVIDATGRARIFSRSLNIEQNIHDTLTGLVLHQLTDDPDGRLIIDAALDGWWYSVVAPKGRRVTGFMTDTETARSRKLRSKGALYDLCNVEKGILSGKPDCWPQVSPVAVAASTTNLNQYAGDKWCAVGDAAATYDPLSSQGIMKAIESGKLAAEWLLEDKLGIYAKWFDEHFNSYLDRRQMYYSANQRSAARPFWKSRSVRARR